MADGGDPGDLRPEPPARASEEPTAPGNLQRGSNVPPAKTSKTSKTSCRFAIERRREALVVAGENRLGLAHWPSRGTGQVVWPERHRICYFVAFRSSFRKQSIPKNNATMTR